MITKQILDNLKIGEYVEYLNEPDEVSLKVINLVGPYGED
jgi:hypothetical protein